MIPSGPLAPFQWLLYGGIAAIIAAVLYCAGRWLRDGARDLDRIGRERAADRRPVARTEQLPLADLVAVTALERYAQWRAASPRLPAVPGATVVCTRCARGDTRLPCACGAECLGGLQ